ncbi:hypothetical protein BGX33_003531 [Mortierella sp. NVP41]|nr:hypothetical protein BGX33_003531 [Mortierella sp. NVP41]
MDHSETLVSITLSSFKVEDTPFSRSASNRIFNKITRTCRRLQVLSQEPHITVIEALEEGEWVCKDLLILRELSTIRASGDCNLAGSGEDGQVNGPETISDRVVRQLLKLPRLKTVWLGTENYMLVTK